MRFLFVDRILELDPGRMVRGVKHVTNDDAYLTTDTQGNACLVPSLIGETLGQLAAWNVMFHNNFTLRPVAGFAGSAKVFRTAYVGETILLESIIDSVDDRVVQYHSQARVGDELIFTLDNALGPMLPMEDFISAEEIRQQFAEINRPGDWAYYLSLPINTKARQKPIKPITPMTFDAILESIPGVSMTAEKKISFAASYFKDHFPRKPVLPLTVLLECKSNLAAEFIAQSGIKGNFHLVEIRKIKMNGFVQPGDVLVTCLKFKEQTETTIILSLRSEVQGKRVCTIEIVLAAIGD